MSRTIPEPIREWLEDNKDLIKERHGEDTYQQAVDGKVPRGELHSLVDDDQRG
jgi:hypothetical protein